ncbi:tetratricopeptide repeat protein [candidate division KSB1 bacterium]|nr:tetratricopeptide repeat protein [candidate division KSB1 bacterium]
MNQITKRKTVTTEISIEEFDDQLTNLDESATPQNDRLQIAKKVLEIPDNFTDKIEIIPNGEYVVFKWHPERYDERAEKLHKNALSLARSGNLDDAIKRWTQASLINSTDPDYYFNLGLAYFEKKQYTEAIENLNRVLAICPFYTKTHLILGTAFLKIRKFEFAKKHLQKSIKYSKPITSAYLNLGAVNSILKLYDEGQKMFEKAIELSPNEPRAYLGIAKIYSTIGNDEKANAFFKKVIELDKKGNLANYAKRSIISENTSNISAKGEANREALNQNPEEYYSEGYRLYISGDYTNAEKMYQNYLKIKPDDDYVWYALGEAQLRSNKAEDAVNSFKKAIKLYPKKGLYFKELAVVFDALNKPDKVIAATSKAKDLGNADSVTYALWGKALYNLGKHSEAIIMLEQSLEINKNNFLAKFYIAKANIDLKNFQEASDYLYEIKEIKINTPLKEKALLMYNKLNEK